MAVTNRRQLGLIPASTMMSISTRQDDAFLKTNPLNGDAQPTQQVWMTAFGLGTQCGASLPFSRLQEDEAGHFGLIFMAMAGYDPHEALALWQRSIDNSSGRAPPEFRRTHPSDATRMAKIGHEMPEALQYYRVAS